MGAFFVASVIIFARRLGPGTLLAIFLTAQLITAVILDACGWLNFKQRPLQLGRVCGVALMLAGVALVTYFDGERPGITLTRRALLASAASCLGKGVPAGEGRGLALALHADPAVAALQAGGGGGGLVPLTVSDSSSGSGGRASRGPGLAALAPAQPEDPALRPASPLAAAAPELPVAYGAAAAAAAGADTMPSHSGTGEALQRDVARHEGGATAGGSPAQLDLHAHDE
jgi:hypothetical protein